MSCGSCHPAEAAPFDRHSELPQKGCHELHDARQPGFLRETTIEFMCTRGHTSAGSPQAGRLAPDAHPRLRADLCGPSLAVIDKEVAHTFGSPR